MKMMLITNENVNRVQNYGFLVAVGPNETITIKESNKQTRSTVKHWLNKDLEKLDIYWPCLVNTLKITHHVYSTFDMIRVYWVYQDVSFDDIVKEFGLDSDEGYERWLDVLLPTINKLNHEFRQTKETIDLERLGFRSYHSVVYKNQQYHSLARNTKGKGNTLMSFDFLDNQHYYQKFKELENFVHLYQSKHGSPKGISDYYKFDISISLMIMKTFIPTMFLEEMISKRLLDLIQ